MEAGLAYLASMEQALASLRDKLLPDFPDRFGVLGESYVSEIRRVRAEVDEYLQVDTIARGRADLLLSLSGVSLGTAPLSAVTGIVDSFRRSLQALAAAMVGGPSGTGRRGKEIEDACDLTLLAVEPGSVEIALELPGSSQLTLLPRDTLGGKAAALFVDVASWAASDRTSRDLVERLLAINIRPSLAAWQVLKVHPREGSPVTGVALRGRLTEGRRVSLGPHTRDRLDSVVREGKRVVSTEQEGTIRSLDLDAASFSLRKRPRYKRNLRCLFDSLALERAVISSTGHRVRVKGEMLLDPVTGEEKEMLATEIEVLDAEETD